MSIRNVGLVGSGVVAHSGLTGLGADDHTIYALLAGRAGGQTAIGGTGTTDGITIQTTSGVGAAGADIHFLVGNNGATEAMTILNNGNVGIGTDAPDKELHVSGFAHITNRIDCDNVIRLFGGTVGAPGIQNRTDTDTGLYLEGSNILSLVTGGVRGLRIDASQQVSIGTQAADRLFHVESATALTDTVSYAQRLTHITSGTPAANFGVGIEGEVETGAGNNEIIGTMEFIASDVTSTAEIGDIVLKLMNAGAAATTKLRLHGDGPLEIFGGVKIPERVETTTYTITKNDFHIAADATSGAFTSTLPPVAGVVGQVFVLSKVDATANGATLKGDGTEKIDATNTKVITTQWNSITVLAVGSGGTDYKII